MVRLNSTKWRADLGTSSTQRRVNKVKPDSPRRTPAAPEDSNGALHGEALFQTQGLSAAGDLPKQKLAPSLIDGDMALCPNQSTVSKEHNYCSQEGSVKPLLAALCFRKRKSKSRARKHSFLRLDEATVSQEAGLQEMGLQHKQRPRGKKEGCEASPVTATKRQKRPQQEKACCEVAQQIHGLPLEDYRQLFCTLVEKALSPRSSPRSGLLQARRVKERLYHAVGCPQYWEVVHPGGQVEVIEGFGQTKSGLAPPHFHIDTGMGESPCIGEPPKKKQAAL
ncbi:hypothetical protein NDU88_005554 [Pleurodeles waltl]|uniref:Uncharacterized protein n=1 Tax=Pleurodeles waltl TaxID=8319 RepID=A0AAV7MY99_PLEWA|nr:hypothetical protein NDU88_005554 [Pleurodeles waltl]